MGYSTYNPLDDYKKEQEEMMKRARKNIENIEQQLSSSEGDSIVDIMENNAKQQEHSANSLNEIAESAKSQAVSAEMLAKSAKDKAEATERAVSSINEISKSAQKIASRSDVKSWISIAISILALIFEIIINWSEILEFIQSLSHN